MGDPKLVTQWVNQSDLIGHSYVWQVQFQVNDLHFDSMATGSGRPASSATLHSSFSRMTRSSPDSWPCSGTSSIRHGRRSVALWSRRCSRGGAMDRQLGQRRYSAARHRHQQLVRRLVSPAAWSSVQLQRGRRRCVANADPAADVDREPRVPLVAASRQPDVGAANPGQARFTNPGISHAEPRSTAVASPACTVTTPFSM